MEDRVEGEPPSYGRRLRQLAEAKSDDLAVLFAAEDGSQHEISWRELDERSTQVARALADEGLGTGDRLAIGLRNSPEHLYAAFGGWKLGAVVVPVRWDLPEWELTRVRNVLRPTVSLERGDTRLFERSLTCPTEPLPDVTPPKARGICSSGSTGTPKIIIVERPGVVDPATISNTSAMLESYGPMPHPQLVLVPGPLYHTVGFSATNHLLAGDSVVLLERFDASRVVLVDRDQGSPRDDGRHGHPAADSTARRHRGPGLFEPAVGPTGGGVPPTLVGSTLDRAGGAGTLFHELRDE